MNSLPPRKDVTAASEGKRRSSVTNGSASRRASTTTADDDEEEEIPTGVRAVLLELRELLDKRSKELAKEK
jgi:hypothetical protein